MCWAFVICICSYYSFRLNTSSRKSLQRSLFHFPVFIFINFFSGVLQLHSDKLLMPFHLCIDAKSFRLKAMQVRVRRYSDSEKHLLKSSQWRSWPCSGFWCLGSENGLKRSSCGTARNSSSDRKCGTMANSLSLFFLFIFLSLSFFLVWLFIKY